MSSLSKNSEVQQNLPKAVIHKPDTSLKKTGSLRLSHHLVMVKCSSSGQECIAFQEGWSLKTGFTVSLSNWSCLSLTRLYSDTMSFTVKLLSQFPPSKTNTEHSCINISLCKCRDMLRAARFRMKGCQHDRHLVTRKLSLITAPRVPSLCWGGRETAVCLVVPRWRWRNMEA